MTDKIKKYYESGAVFTIIIAIIVAALAVIGLSSRKSDSAEYFHDSGEHIHLFDYWVTTSDTVAEITLPESVPDTATLRFETYYHAAKIYLNDELILDAPDNEETSCVYNYWRTLEGCPGSVLRLEAETPEELKAMITGNSVLGPQTSVFREFMGVTFYAGVYFIFSAAAAIFIGFLLTGLARGSSTLANNHVSYLIMYILIAATSILTDSQLPSMLGMSSDLISVLNALSTGFMAPAIFHFVMSFYNRYNKKVRIYLLIVDGFVILNFAAWVLFGLPLFRFMLFFHAIIVVSIVIASAVIFSELRFNPSKENRLFAAAVTALIMGSATSIVCYYFGPPRSSNIMFALTMLIFVSMLTVIVFRNMQARINAGEKERRRALSRAKDDAESIGNAKTALVRSISFGIRMPMNAVQGYVSLAKAHVNDPEYLSDCLSKADSAGHQVIDLLDEMLNVYRTESGQLEFREEVMDIVHYFREITGEISDNSQDKSIRCSFDVSYVTNRYVVIDRAYFAGLLRTLMNNAFKHTGPGGIIYCELKQEASPNVGYSGFSLTVSDNGEGMTAEELELINSDSELSPEAVVTSAWNTSMFLYVYKRILRSVGGIMDIDSNPGEGTTVTVSIDLKNSETPVINGVAARQLLKDANNESFSAKGKRVLVVDDNEQSLDIISSLLQDMGVEVETANDGSIAVEMVRNSAANHFDLVLMDIVMPYMDGRRAAGLIRSLGSKAKASVPIVGMSADVFDDANETIAEAGIQEMLYKPVGIRDLNRILMKYAPDRKKR